MAEPVDVHVLVGQAADGVVVPDDGDVASAGAAAGRRHAAGQKSARSTGRSTTSSTGGRGGALLHQQVGVEVKQIGERLGGNAALTRRSWEWGDMGTPLGLPARERVFAQRAAGQRMAWPR